MRRARPGSLPFASFGIWCPIILGLTLFKASEEAVSVTAHSEEVSPAFLQQGSRAEQAGG